MGRDNWYQKGFEDGSNASVAMIFFLDDSDDYHPPADPTQKEHYDKGFEAGRANLRLQLNNPPK